MYTAYCLLAAYEAPRHVPRETDGGRTRSLETSADLVTALDAAVIKGRTALKGTNDAHLAKHWRLLAGGQILQDTPRHVQIRDGVQTGLGGSSPEGQSIDGTFAPSIFEPRRRRDGLRRPRS